MKRSSAAWLAILASFNTWAADRSLDIAAPWEIKSADPSTSGYVFSRMRVAENLVTTDNQGQLAPGLASAWEVSDDGLEWRFTLRENAHFHDGTAVSADAVVNSLEASIAKPGMLDTAPIASVEAVGDDVVIKLESAFAPLPALLAHSTTLILAEAAYAENGDVTQMIGSGPYQVDELSPPQRMTVTRFDDYWGAAPAIAAASYLAVSRGETRALMAESGDADIVFTLDPASQARLSRNASLSLHSEPLPRTIMLKLNASHPFLDDKRARQALSMAIDRAGIAAGLLRAPEAAATELFPESLGAWHLGVAPSSGQDIEKAQALLAELGWEPNEEGLLERDGQPFKLTLRTYADRPELPLVATALQSQWRELGVDLEVAVGNASAIPSGHHDDSLEVGLSGRNYGLVPNPLVSLLDDIGSDPDNMGGDWGTMNWRDDEVAEWLDTLRQSTEEQALNDLAPLVAERLHQEMPLIPVAWYQQTAAVSDEVEGFSIDPLERSYRIDQMEWAE
ncbi:MULTISPECIES: ABC transporter substrate-binding protein [unclassified Halomonas]|uniref:ABC transporter substrate-binding protein n=1 Tax=unclassified Halomonas TaxID=2609666 RepID=UPI000A5C8373|nr:MULTISPECIES: ABC transporter substrate-binding protein [unclassified Halomonas]MBT2786857.1 ABC transporter substrate-binding protein [Halomonas sp. ISL-106]MBT2798490.1 ABC transporter substrate-binding protein [Halomonas sp. ISL-104]